MSTLLAIRGPLTGARIALQQGDNFLGRATDATVTVADSVVSRTHAVIRPARLGWTIEDCGSSAGTFLNGRKVETATALAPNDEIRVGHSIFLFDSEFDLQNADFTDNIVYLSAPQDDTVAVDPVATLEPPAPHTRESRDAPARHGVELLTEIGELFDSSRVAFGDALRSTTERMSRLLRADVALLMLYDHGAAELRPSAAVAKGNVLADRTVLRKVFGERRAILLSDKPDLVGHPAPNAPETPRLRSLIAAPLLVDSACLGLIYFERQELDAYTLKDLRLVQSLGRLMAVFVEARQKSEAMALRANFEPVDSAIIGGSPAFKKAMDMLRRVADTPSTVLLVGETGTGKEVLAAELHRLSPQGRAGRPFVAVNCAAIPEPLFESELFGHEKGSFTGAHRMHQGLVEQAQSGTLFLDEIGELSLAMQPKLLRFLQEHTFSRVGGARLLRAEVRVVAATNRDLSVEVREGRFREDLYHRICVLPVEVPPLRDRREDIRALAEHYCQKYAKSLRRHIIGISDEAIIQLEKHPWPGNVREFSNCMERAVLLCDDRILLPRHFTLGGLQRGAAEIKQSKTVMLDGGELRPLHAVEKEHITAVMKHASGNQVRAAEILGIHRNTLRKKLQEYGLL